MTQSPPDSFPSRNNFFGFFYTRLIDICPPDPHRSRSRCVRDRHGARDDGGRNMSQLAKAILGTIAVSLTFGAVQLALGRDLARPQDAAGTSATDPAATAT